MRKFIFLFSSLVLAAAMPVCAQNLVFNKLSTDDGLSHYTALSMYEDEFGSVWVASPMGVSRCSGTQVISYLHDADDPHSLYSNNVSSVTGNRDGQVFILTKNSLEIFDLRQDCISLRHEFNNDFHIDGIYWNDGLYAIANGSEVIRWNSGYTSFEVLYRLPEGQHYYNVCVDGNGGIWVSSSSSLHYIDKGLKFGFDVLSDTSVYSMYMDGGRMFLGTMNEGLVVIGADFMVCKRVTAADGLVSDFVRTVCRDDAGNYWIGTDKGLNRLDAGLQVRDLYRKDEMDSSLSNSSIYDIINDSQGNIWIGTYFGGINIFNPSSQIYTLLKPSTSSSEGLSSSFVSCMLEDKRHNLWIGTVDGGLTCYDRKDKVFKHFQCGPQPESVSGDNIKSLYYDENDDVLWVGTHLAGLNRLDLKTMEFKHYHLPGQENFFMPDIVSGIVPYKDGLVLSSYCGIFFFDPRTEEFEKLLQLTFIRTIFMDSHHCLWLGNTNGQLFSYDMESCDLASYGGKIKDLDGRMYAIYDMAEDNDGCVWMATFGGGVKKFDPRTGKLISFTTRNSGLPSNNILSIISLGDNRLMATDHNGYVIYDQVKSQFFSHNRQVGLPVDYIMENSLYASDDGTVYIGTNDGLLYFNVDDIKSLPKVYPLSFSHLWVNGEEVKPGDGSGILDESMRYVSKIMLKSGQNSFAVSFDIPEYYSNMDFNLVYRFGNEDDVWQRVLPGERFIKFYNLSPGKYQLNIKSQEGDINEVMEQKLDIVIAPPFYKTVYAYVFYVLVLLIFIGCLVYVWANRLKMNERLRYEKKKAYDEKILSQSKLQSKLQFFYGISHEFSTPLTIIIGELELLLMKYDFAPEIKDKMENVYKNSLLLHDLIFELLEFRKQETRKQQLRVTEQDLCTVAEESFNLYKEYAASRGISFTLNEPSCPVFIWCDRKLVYKVINNLLSNAFKYTDAGGQVTLEVSSGTEEVLLEVSDTGCGMDKSDLEHIFADFYQGRFSGDKLGVGLGLALVKNIVEMHHGKIEVQSELHKGTSFTVRFRSGNSHFTEKEMSDGQVAGSSVQAAISAQAEPVMEDMMDYTLLIVEDNAPLRKMLVNIFSQYYKVLSACDGAEGWELIAKVEPDIVVSDIVMPNMSGTELCRKIKDSIDTCHIPVVLLSVRAEVQNCIEGFDARADDYIAKPFSVRLLLTRCRNLLLNRKTLHDKFKASPAADVEVLTNNDLDRRFTEKLVGLIESNIDNQDLNINFLLKEMYVSRTTLFNKLKAVTGQTPMEFILNIRLKKAAELLLNRKDLPIGAVSDAVGFCSAKYFSRVFKETYHIRPMDYRNGKIPLPED